MSSAVQVDQVLVDELQGEDLRAAAAWSHGLEHSVAHMLGATLARQSQVEVVPFEDLIRESQRLLTQLRTRGYAVVPAPTVTVELVTSVELAEQLGTSLAVISDLHQRGFLPPVVGCSAAQVQVWRAHLIEDWLASLQARSEKLHRSQDAVMAQRAARGRRASRPAPAEG